MQSIILIGDEEFSIDSIMKMFELGMLTNQTFTSEFDGSDVTELASQIVV